MDEQTTPTPKTETYTPRRRRTLGMRDLRRLYRSVAAAPRLSLKRWARQLNPHDLVNEQKHTFVMTPKVTALVGGKR